MENPTIDLAATPAKSATDEYFALRSIGLGDRELSLLRRTGYLEPDRRWPAHCCRWLLRFREHQSLRTIHLGNDAKLAGRVLRELSILRSTLCPRRELRRAVQQARQLLRHVKYQLTMCAPDLDLHAKARRKSRRRNLDLRF